MRPPDTNPSAASCLGAFRGAPLHTPIPFARAVWNALYGGPSRSVTALLTALRAAAAPVLTPHVATCPPLVTPLHAGGLGLSL